MRKVNEVGWYFWELSVIQDRHVPGLGPLNSISCTVVPVIEDLRQVGTSPDAGNGPGTALLIDLKL